MHKTARLCKIASYKSFSYLLKVEIASNKKKRKSKRIKVYGIINKIKKKTAFWYFLNRKKKFKDIIINIIIKKKNCQQLFFFLS